MASLRYLDLSYTCIEQLPFGLKELKMLIHLNLEHTSLLHGSLRGISKLSSLRTLRVKFSELKLDMTLMKELEVLEHLEYITIGISQSLVEKQLSYDSIVWRCIHEVEITDLPKKSIRIIVLPEAMINLHHINIARCQIIEIKIEKTSWNKSLSTPSFSSLSMVIVGECDGLKDLTWLLFAPNLTCLSVSSSSQIESIINREKAASVLDKEESCKIIPFRKLEYLYLSILPELNSIYWTSLPFPSLKEINISSCENLRKLPLDSQSVAKIEELTINVYSLSTPSFSNLSTVRVSGCDCLKDLTWLLFAPNLTLLQVSSSKQVESIINKEKAASVLGKDGSCKIIPFRKLEYLVLSCLPELKSIYWTSLPFPCLRYITISDCENLRKLPLDSQSVAKIEEFTINVYTDEEWIERIEWEDEDTKLRFFLTFL